VVYPEIKGALKSSVLFRGIWKSNALTGKSAFIDEIEQRIGLRVEFGQAGRPKK